MTAYLVPLQATPQTLSISLAGTVYNLNVYWCKPAACWMLDLADSSDNPLVGGIPLITGADLLAQYPDLGIAGALYAQTTGDVDTPPTFANLGQGGNLYFVTS